MKRKPAKRNVVAHTRRLTESTVGNNTCSHCGAHLTPDVYGFLCPRCANAYLLRHVPKAERRAQGG